MDWLLAFGIAFGGFVLVVFLFRVFTFDKEEVGLNSTQDYFNWFKEHYPTIKFHWDEGYLVSPLLHENQEYELVDEFWGYRPRKSTVKIINKGKYPLSSPFRRWLDATS